MRRVLVPLAALGLALVTACGGRDAEPAAGGAPAAAADPRVRQQEMQNVLADCMTKKGFQYVAYVAATGDSGLGRLTGPLSILESPNEVRAFREKYGFGVYARMVYPNDPAVATPETDAAKDPNTAIREALDPARRKAYDLALNGNQEGVKGDRGLEKVTGEPGCGGEASIKVYGEGRDEAATGDVEQAYAAFQADPEVVAAAQKYADCLRGQGYKVTTTRPGEIEDTMNSAALDGMLPAQAGPDGAEIPVGGAVTAAAAGDTRLDPEVARAGLQTEIKAALADLGCRTDYALVVRTKHAGAVAGRNGN